MQVEDALEGVSRLFLDTAPVIYEVERNPAFTAIVDPIFDRLDEDIVSVVSPVTLAECLVVPIRLGLTDLQNVYLNLFNRQDVVFAESTLAVAQTAARIRAQHNFLLADSFQIATAVQSGCDGFLTNDTQLNRFQELNVIVVSELEV